MVLFCSSCQVNLCQICIGKHISDDPLKHLIVLFSQRKSALIYPKCLEHDNWICENQCEECNSLVCAKCISGKHKGHTFSLLCEIYNSKKSAIEEDANKMKNQLFTYRNSVAEIKSFIDILDAEYEQLSVSVTEQGTAIHRLVDNVTKRLKIEIHKMKTGHLEILKKDLNRIEELHSSLQSTLDKTLDACDSVDVFSTMQYGLGDTEFTEVFPMLILPHFSPAKLNVEQFDKLFGTLSSNSFTAEETSKQMLEEPDITTIIETGYNSLYNVSAIGEEEVWTSGQTNEMRCFNMQGVLLKTVPSLSGEQPQDITVTSNGDLVYLEGQQGTVNLVKYGRTEEMIHLQDWTPLNLCTTISRDLLISMCSNDLSEAKVVRYTNSIEKQTIQYHEGEPLYSAGDENKYITENRNLDICVADCLANAIVVVNHGGKLLFRYTGHPSSSTKNQPFTPAGIATDSLKNILIADTDNHCIHILNEKGHFLCFINRGLKDPWGLCIDKYNSLFLTETGSGKVKEIKYLG